MPIKYIEGDSLDAGDAVLLGFRPVASEVTVYEALDFDALQEVMKATGQTAEYLDKVKGMVLQKFVLLCPLCGRSTCKALHEFKKTLSLVDVTNETFSDSAKEYSTHRGTPIPAKSLKEMFNKFQTIRHYLQSARDRSIPMEVVFLETWLIEGYACDRVEDVGEFN